MTTIATLISLIAAAASAWALITARRALAAVQGPAQPPQPDAGPQPIPPR